jgi:hypothetical protein
MKLMLMLMRMRMRMRMLMMVMEVGLEKATVLVVHPVGRSATIQAAFPSRTS